MTEKFKGLNQPQILQVEKQITSHNHDEYKLNRTIAGNNIEITVLPTILRPEAMASKLLSDFLDKIDFTGLDVADLGSGTGIQGIVTALNGAENVILSDITSQAVKNSRLNVTNLGLQHKVKVLQSDLFLNYEPNKKFDVIIFNHPFFPTKPIEDLPQTIAMFDEGNLLNRFLEDAKKFLKPSGKIIMPYFSLAGDINDPKIQGEKFGYSVDEEIYSEGVGIQNSTVKICTLTIS